MKKSIYLILIIAFLYSCGKYEEGPKVSFKSRQKRIEGLWKIHKLTVNDIDSTSFFIAKYGTNLDITDGKWELPVSQVAEYSLSGEWNWHMFKYYTNFNVETLKFDNVQFDAQAIKEDTMFNADSVFMALNYNLMGPFKLDREIQWEIKRIHTSELFLETLYKDMIYRLELTLEKDYE